MQNYKKNFVTRTLAWVLAAVMVIAMVPVGVFAAVDLPDWDNNSTKQEEVDWNLPSGAKVIDGKMVGGDPLTNVGVTFIGHFIDENGRTVLAGRYSHYQTITTAVWKHIAFRFDDDLYEKIDFDKSYILSKDGVTQQKFTTATFIGKKERVVPFETQGKGSQERNFYLVLKGDRNDNGVEKKAVTWDDVIADGGHTVQTRIYDNTGGRVWSKSSTAYKDPDVRQNYSTYTQSFAINDLVGKNNNFVNSSEREDKVSLVTSVGGRTVFLPEQGILRVIYQYTKEHFYSDTPGEYKAFRQAFSNDFVNYLKPDDNDIVAKMYIKDHAFNDYGGKIRTPIKMENLNRTADTASFIIADSKFNVPDELGLKTVLVPAGEAKNSVFSELEAKNPVVTIVDYNIDTEKITEELFEKGSTATTFSFHSFYLDDSKPITYFDGTVSRELKVPTGSTVEVNFGQGIKGSNSMPNVMFGENKALDLIYSSSNGEILRKNTGIKYTIEKGFVLDAGTKISVVNFNNSLDSLGKVVLSIKDKSGNLILTQTLNKNPVQIQKPKILQKSELLTKGILNRTNPPIVDEIFTEDSKISGLIEETNAMVHAKYSDNSEQKIFAYEEYDTAPDGLTKAEEYKTSGVTTKNVSGKEYSGYVYEINDISKKGTLLKDMPIAFRVRTVSSVKSEPVIEQVQAKVTFKPGGPLGDDVSYEKIAPLNNDYLYNYDDETNTFAKNDSYKPSGFGELDDDGKVVDGTLDNIKVDTNKVVEVDGENMINYINHDGKTYDKNDANQKQALIKRQWPKIKGEDGSKFINGKVLLGWTTVKLEDDQDGTAVEKYNKLLEENKVVTDLNQWKDAKKNAYVYNSKSPIEEAITVYGVWGEPAIRLHSNFDKDESVAGMQEDVDTQVLEKVVLDQLKAANADPTTIDATLKEVYAKNEFKREGYSLVGFSRTANADEPDINVTGNGLLKDLYLRDGDKFKLAANGSQETSSGPVNYDYKFDATKGLDLYAVWKEDFTVKATKAWLDKKGASLTPKAENVSALKFALIGRPAVGTFGSEVIVKDATYHPIEGTIKDFTGSDLTWGEGPEGKLKGYDTKGRRMSYLIVELTNATQEAAFNAGSTNWSDYGIKITEPDPANHVYGHKDQVISFKNGTDVDTFTGATTRLHKTATNPEGVNPHGSGPAPTVGYFDTTGYVINVNNKEVVVPYPTIEQGYTGDNTITVNPPEKMVDKITVTLPDNTTAVFKKNAAGTGYEASNEGTTSATLEVTDGKLVITPATPLAKDQVVKAKAETEIAGQNIPSEEVSMKVIDRKVSNKPEELKQEKYDESGNVPISFKVPDNITDKPVPGTVYTVVTVDDQGNETPTTYKYTIPADGAETIPGTRQTITVPKSELKGKKVIIKAEEPNKTEAKSDQLELDFVAPEITPDARDERWRRWTDIDVQLSEALDGKMKLTYKENGVEKSEEYDTKEELKYAIERLKLKDNITDMKITGSDKFGNEGYGNANYQPIGQTQIIVSPIRAGKNFVIVKATEANTKVVVNVYDSGTLLDNYKRDKYFDFEGKKPTPKATVTMILTEANKPYRLRIKDSSGTNYKLQAGDVIDIVGTIGTKGPDYKITNPFTEIVK